MTVKVKDLTEEELQKLISQTMNDVVEDLLEDILGLSSEEYTRSVEDARKDYREGKVTKIEDLP